MKFRLEEEVTKEKLINILIYLLIWILPFFMVTKVTGKGSEFGKGMFSLVIAIIILIAMIKDRKIKIDLISKVTLIYLMLVFISTLFSMDIKRSIIGANGRYEGLIMISVYVILFFAAKNYFSIDKKAFTMALALVTILALLALIQFNGFDPIWGQKAYFGKALTKGIQEGLSDEILFPKYLTTIGNRNFVSTYFSLFLPVTIGGYIFYKNKYCFISSLFIFGALLCTLTRSGYIGFIFAGIILLIILIKKRDKEFFRRLAIIALAFILIFGFINIRSKGAVVNRLGLFGKDVTSFSEKSGSSRIGIWKLVIKIVEEKPVLGTGPDTLDKALPKICGDDYEKLGFIVDKAHNEFLQIAATMGIPALITYLIFLMLILKNLLKHIEDDKYKVLLLVFVAFITQSFFNISIISVASIVWIFFGVMSKERIS
ncbi:O-antigen ligase family protein [Clostridium bornimense]|uniref:O-antigen ligase family protein n=1 Tax=Clostridium bornimense TaxID=1216932 RepID=UPI001C1063D8|nr:O-antigen ligase family protein [Clostridium bornimense]MBU5317431.1 O-antigen ligase family protein [Clostridium bornimense]